MSSYKEFMPSESKADPLQAKVLKTPIGSMLAVCNQAHLLLLDFMDSNHFDSDLKRLLKNESKTIVEYKNAKPIKILEEELALYFKGELKKFTTPFQFNPNQSEFQQAVWQEIHRIGFGKTNTYTGLAEAIGKPNSYRAVANACGQNPLTIVIPCHRVLKKDGGAGGYSSGLDRKTWLLDHEGITTKD